MPVIRCKPAAFYFSRAVATVDRGGVDVLPASRVASMSAEDLANRREVALLRPVGWNGLRASG